MNTTKTPKNNLMIKCRLVLYVLYLFVIVPVNVNCILLCRKSIVKCSVIHVSDCELESKLHKTVKNMECHYMELYCKHKGKNQQYWFLYGKSNFGFFKNNIRLKTIIDGDGG